MAQVCLSVCGLTRFSPSDGQDLTATDTCLARRSATASVLRRPPNLVGNSGAEAGPGLSASHARKTRTVPVVSGVRRSRLPFPAQWTLAPDNSSTSPRVQAGQLRDPQAGLECQRQQRIVAPTSPAGAVGCSQQCLRLGPGEEADEALVGTFAGDGEDPGDHASVLRATWRRVGEQRVHRGQAQVAGGDTVGAFVLEVVQEGDHHLRADVCHVEARRRLSCPCRGKAYQ